MEANLSSLPIRRRTWSGLRAVIASCAGVPLAWAQPLVTDKFESDSAGWTLYSDGEDLYWSPIEGNPNGCIGAKDGGDGGWWGFSAAPRFLGDRSCFYNGRLRWDFKTTHSGGGTTQPDAFLEGAGLSLVINLANPVVDEWETRTVTLNETAGWRKNSVNGAVPTAAEFQSVLASLAAIRLRGEFSTAANDRCVLDTVSFGSFIIDDPISTSACATSNVTFSSLATGVGPISYRWQYEASAGVWTNVPEGPIPYAFGTIEAIGCETPQLSLGLNTSGGAVPLRLRCMVSNACGSVPSEVAVLAPCQSDLNCDGVVEDLDFVEFVKGYNLLDCADPAMPAGCPADVNGDGLVDDADFVVFVSAYNALGCL